MEYKFVDTNIFIEVFARNGNKSNKSKQLLKESKNLITTSFVISEVEWVLRSVYLLDRKGISKYIKFILSSNIEIDNKKPLVNCLRFYESNNVDWIDCLNMYVLKELGVSKVFSYDKGMVGYDWVERLEP